MYYPSNGGKNRNQKSFGIYTPLHTRNHNAFILDRGAHIPYFIIKEEDHGSQIICELVGLKKCKTPFYSETFRRKIMPYSRWNFILNIDFNNAKKKMRASERYKSII